MQDCGFCYAIPSFTLYKTVRCAADWTVGSDFRSKARHIASSSNKALTPRIPTLGFGLWALGADFGRSEIGLMESRVATDWAHRVRGSQNGTKESTRQSKLRSMMLREYYLLFPSGHQQESHKTSWIGYVFQSMGIREHVVICSAIRNSRINSAFPNGGCHM